MTRQAQVLAFDVFGTVVDWHGSLVRELQVLAPQVDGNAFALAWRAGYQPAMQRVRSGELGWTRIDELHRIILDDLLPRFGLSHFDEAQRQHLNRAWHRLDPWPDVLEGLRGCRGTAFFRRRSFGPTSQIPPPTWGWRRSSMLNPMR
jgi:2-haloacid dehalogenase